MSTIDSPKVIDLSAPLEKNAGEPEGFSIVQIPHKDGGNRFGHRLAFSRKGTWRETVCSAFYWITGRERLRSVDFPEGEFINQEFVTASTHTGTHMDAPFHFGTRCEGKPAKTIDQIPLEWCMGNGVLLDMRHKKNGDILTPSDLREALRRISHSLSPGEIVLLYTGADRFWGKESYMGSHPGLTQEGVSFFLDHGIHVIGTDGYGLDRPFRYMAEEYFQTRDTSVLFPAHFFGRKRAYCHVERLSNLGALPTPTGFQVYCFPIRVTGAGAAWCRAVAVVHPSNDVDENKSNQSGGKYI